MKDEVIEYVEAEIVDAIPTHSASVPIVNPEDIPDGALNAPPIDTLVRRGYFQKGGIGGPGRKRALTKEQLIAGIEEYFTGMIVSVHNPATGRMEYKWTDTPTITGLARSLGIDARTMYRYQESDDMGDIVCAARDVIQEYVEKGAIAGAGNPAGKIFILKNLGLSDTKTYTFAPPSRLQAAKTTDEIAQLVDEDIVD